VSGFLHRTNCRKRRADAIAVCAVAWLGVKRGFALRHECFYFVERERRGEGIANGTPPPIFPCAE
jgi:hypothetical protein